jgi:hypothetical protein
MSLSQPSNRLTISVGQAVQLIFFIVDLLLDPLHAVHRPPVPCDPRTERLIAYLLEGFVDLVTQSVVAAETEQLLVGVVRRRAVIMRSGAAWTSPWYTTPPL